MLSVVFFGNSQSVFSNRHYKSLSEAACLIAGVVDVPPSKRKTTTAPDPSYPAFTDSAWKQRIPVFEPASPNDADFVASMKTLKPDLFIAIGYTNLLRNDILSVPRLFAVNFHASLLPAYRGKHPVFWAMRNGEKKTGLTVHYMGPGLDTGDILYRVKVRIGKTDTVSAVYGRIMAKSEMLFARLLADAGKGKAPCIPQGKKGASYGSSVCEEDFMLDVSISADKLLRRITMSPGECFFDVSGTRCWVQDARMVRCHGKPGTLSFERAPASTSGTRGAIIYARNGGLCVNMLRLKHGETVGAAEFFAHLGLKEGDIICP